MFPHVENPFNNWLFKLAEVSLAALVKRLFVFLGVAEFLNVALPIAKLIGLDCKIPADRAKRLSCSQSFIGSSYHLELVADRKSSCGGHDIDGGRRKVGGEEKMKNGPKKRHWDHERKKGIQVQLQF